MNVDIKKDISAAPQSIRWNNIVSKAKKYDALLIKYQQLLIDNKHQATLIAELREYANRTAGDQ